MRVKVTDSLPSCGLDQCPQRMCATTPGEPGGVDRATCPPLVRVQEPVREPTPDHPGGGAHRRRSTEGRVGEHQGREREVVVRVGEDRRGPVDQRPPAAVDEQIERVQIAVADHAVVRRQRGDRRHRVLKVGASDDLGLGGDPLEEVDDVQLSDVPAGFAGKTVDRAPVQRGCGLGEEVGESSHKRRR